jgi:Tetracyclin repressor-like, C-terminal domain
MVNVVFSKIGLPAGDAGWKAAMRQRAIAAREVLGRHRWAIGLMESRRSPGPATLRGDRRRVRFGARASSTT